MASSEHLLISKIIQSASVTEVVDAGVRPDHFTSELSTVYMWILSYWREYSAVPTPRVVKQQFADLQLVNAEAEPFPRLIDELYMAYKHKHLVLAVTAATPSLNNHDTDEATKILSEGLQKAALEVAHLRDVDIIQSWEQRIERYREMRDTPNFLRGIPTGFNGLDKITAGFRPQQLITFVGEAKKGKSLMTLIMAQAAHAHGITPMYVSFEMSIEEQEARYDALVAGVSHNKIMRGDLNLAELEKIEQSIKIRKNMHPFIMTEDASSLTTVSAIAGKIQQYIMAQAAHAHGITPMYVSFEMSIEEQEARYDALVAGVSHNKIMRGDLNLAELEKIEQSIKIRKNMHPFIMTEDASSLTTVSAIAGKIQQYRPGLVIVDGVYLMDDENGEPKGSPQALTNITRALKRLAQRFDVPLIGTTQVLAWKLGNKKSRQITSDSIGYTSSFAQDSDLILGVESDPDIDNQAIIRVVLARTAPKGEVRIKWDWDNMNFTEVGEDGEEADNDGWYY